MVIMFLQIGHSSAIIIPWRGNAIREDIVDGLDMKGFLDFGVWGDEEVEEDEDGYEEEEEG